VVQFAEAAGHSHVHFHIIPRMPDQAAEVNGPRIFKYLGVPEEQQVRESAMNQLALEIRRSLSDL
jgi:diadenosine tetraphosphate (Ap4A) HIT family hydrolase